MADPFTAAAVGALVLTEGIKFLYGQAGDVLKRWRDRRAGDPDARPAPLRPPGDLLEGAVEAVEPRDDVAGALEAELGQARQALLKYVDDPAAADLGNPQVWAEIDVLRRMLEAVYEQRITFRGERREPSGPLVKGQIDVTRVAGDAAAVRARSISSGQVHGIARADTVEEGGSLTGVQIDRIGD